MATISATMVKDLREKTGAGMMDCKAALAETKGDVEAAVDWLRTKGLAKAAKKAGRIAAEGLIGLAADAKQAALVEVNSETDFVARNAAFQKMASGIAEAALQAKGDLDKLSKSKFPGGFTATLPYPDSEQTLGKAALALSQNLKQLGITLSVKQVPTDEWFGTLYSHPKPLGPQIISWGVDYPDPADALHFIYDSTAATANNFNTANYKNAQMDKLLKIQQDSVNPKVRADAVANALKLTARDIPYIPLWYQEVAMALKTKYVYADFGTWYLYTPWATQITAK